MKRFLPLLIILPLLLWIACEDNEVWLNARVDHTGQKIIVYNNDKFDWKEVELELNDDYVVKINVIPAGGRRTFSLRLFSTREEGKLFNSNTHRVMNFRIRAKLKDGKDGFYGGNWN